MHCACVVRWDGPRKDGNVFIHYCPLHATAPELLKVLESLYKVRTILEVLGEWVAFDVNRRLEATERAKVDVIMENVRITIATAKGQVDDATV